MFIFELYTFCVLYVHKFVYELCVHIDVYSNVYLLYTISTRVYGGHTWHVQTCWRSIFSTLVGRWQQLLMLLFQFRGLHCSETDVASASSLSVLKNRLKTYLFHRCYETDWIRPTFLFPGHILSPPRNSGPCNSFHCLGHFKNVYDDDDVIKLRATCVAAILVQQCHR